MIQNVISIHQHVQDLLGSLIPQHKEEVYCKAKYEKIVTKRCTQLINRLELGGKKLYFDDNSPPKQ